MTIGRRWLVLGMLAGLVLSLTSVVAASAARTTADPTVAVQQELDAIRQLMQQSQEAYRRGDHQQALQLARQAYLDHFELIEIPLRVADPNFTFTMEVKFARWRQLIQENAAPEEIARLLFDIDQGLVDVERVIGTPGLAAPFFVSVASFSVLFREGIEAILVIAALLGYLRTHQPSLRRPLWIGAALAIPASIATWLVLVVLLDVVPVGRELLESVMSLLAVVLMISISLWLLRRIDTRRWMEFLRAHAWEAVATGNASAVALLGFTTIYREGAETAVLYQSLVLMARRLELWVIVGIVAAALALAALAWGVIGLGARLPLRLFLSLAIIVIMVLSIAVLGHAIWELQMLGYLPVTVVALPPMNRGLSDLLGLHPTRETLLAQGALLFAYLVAWGYAFRTWQRSTAVRPVAHLSNR